MRIAIVTAAFLVAIPTFGAYRISAWIPPWDANALTSMQSNVGTLNESNPVWYSWNADSTIAKNWNAESPTWRAAMTGSSIIPTVQNVINHSFNGSAAATMLASASTRDAHANAIVQLVTSNAFDGIDVDYESIPTASRADFTAFVTTLASKLHAAGRKLSVTVYAKSSDEMWTGAGAEDWTAIGALADSVKIMAYDYHWSTSGPGDIAPLDWLDAVATYAQSTIPSSKIIIGLPWYGYDWSGSSGVGVSYASAMQTAQTNGVAVTHDASGEATFAYGAHVVYFNDATSYKAKVDLIKQKHGSIGGFGHWAAGSEDPAVWTLLRGATSVTPPAPPPPAPVQPAPVDFTVSGSTSTSVMQGSATSMQLGLVPINNFTGSATVSLVTPPGFVTLSSQNVTLSSPVTMTIAPTYATLAGVYVVTLRFTSGTLTHDVPFTVTVEELPKHRRAAAR